MREQESNLLAGCFARYPPAPPIGAALADCQSLSVAEITRPAIGID